ncbi:MAG TPA: restriction endonuclease [Chthoniobacteraceae bacterium]|nr:restriction endonuclease [Chthoniobacteraceae bacterium]
MNLLARNAGAFGTVLPRETIDLLARNAGAFTTALPRETIDLLARNAGAFTTALPRETMDLLARNAGAFTRVFSKETMEVIARNAEAFAKGFPTGDQWALADERVEFGEFDNDQAEQKEVPEAPTLVVQGVVTEYGKSTDGALVRVVAPIWENIVNRLQADWAFALEIPSRIWEEMVAAAFDRAGFDEVILTPRSGDFGRDVIATRNGVLSVRIIGSVKAYKPGHLVKHDDVRALAGILLTDTRATKGIVTTTSDFAPGIPKDPFIAPLLPHRLELMNGPALRSWFKSLRQ